MLPVMNLKDKSAAEQQTEATQKKKKNIIKNTHLFVFWQI